MTRHCDFCEYEASCPIAHVVSFCEDCRHYDDCDILSLCEGDQYVECDNGFEGKLYSDEYDDCDEEDQLDE